MLGAQCVGGFPPLGAHNPTRLGPYLGPYPSRYPPPQVPASTQLCGHAHMQGRVREVPVFGTASGTYPAALLALDPPVGAGKR